VGARVAANSTTIVLADASFLLIVLIWHGMGWTRCSRARLASANGKGRGIHCRGLGYGFRHTRRVPSARIACKIEGEARSGHLPPSAATYAKMICTSRNSIGQLVPGGAIRFLFPFCSVSITLSFAV